MGRAQRARLTHEPRRTHMDQHNRPYKCGFADCPFTTKGFGSEGELRRHVNSVHKRLNVPCPVPGCSYSCARKDNLQGHIKRRHKDRIPEDSATLQGSRNSPAGYQDIDLSRKASPADRVDVAGHGTRKRRHSQEGASSSQGVGSVNELREVQEENKKLKRKVETLERELELSKKREETLFDVIRKYTEQP